MIQGFRAIVWVVAGCLAIMLPSAPAHAGPLTNFTGREKMSTNLSLFPKWNGVLARYFNQRSLALRPCGSVRYNPCSLRGWVSYVQSLGNQSQLAQVTSINRYLNAVPYVMDPVNWGIDDYWETPNEFLEVAGDCEDYAISKYISLRALGIPSSQLRVMVVLDMNLNVMHSILAAKIDGEVYILDNQIPRVVKANTIYHYRPIYSINEKAWWRH